MPRTFTLAELYSLTVLDRLTFSTADLNAYYTALLSLPPKDRPKSTAEPPVYLDGDYAKVGSYQASDWGD